MHSQCSALGDTVPGLDGRLLDAASPQSFRDFDPQVPYLQYASYHGEGSRKDI